MSKIRQFKTGATRDTQDGKIDPEAFYSPIVVKRFCDYMQKHRLQPDGNVREGDNWQKLFGEDHYAVCMKSGWRHFLDWWLEHRGFKSRDGIEEAICGLIFNAQAYLYKILMEEHEKNT